MVSKLRKMQDYIPSIYRPRVNPIIRGVLRSWASEDDRLVQAVQDAKEQIYVATAQLQYLDALGSNVGVFRPQDFNLVDSIYRQLIPALSYAPKQIRPTIKRVLDIFFGENNPRVKIAEINPNQIKITIPSTVPSLRKNLRGSHHFHNYSGTIVSVNNLLKTMTVDLYGTTKTLAVDEFANSLIGQNNVAATALSSTGGQTGIIIQFPVSADLSGFVVGEEFVAAVPTYPGSFLPDKTRAYTLSSQRGILGQSIVAGQFISTLTMIDSSNIPDEKGFVSFNFGHPTEEVLVRYFGRPNNTTLLLDPSYIFQSDHFSGETVNVLKTPYLKPRPNGSDYSVYLVGVEAARLVAQRIVEEIAAAGVVIEWTVLFPTIDC